MDKMPYIARQNLQSTNQTKDTVWGGRRVVARLADVGDPYLSQIKGCGPESCPVWGRLKWTVAQ